MPIVTDYSRETERLFAHLVRTWASYHFLKKHKTMYSACDDVVCVEERALLLLRPGIARAEA